MTIRNFDALFEPKAIALIGASNREGSVGAVLARNLLEAGFKGPIMPVNPRAEAIRSTISYSSVAELPVTPDLAVIATPPETVPGLIAELGERGCRAAVVITAGVGDGKDGEKGLRKQMLDAARPHLMRIVGPNCIGLISPHRGINASFAHLTPPAGDLAFITQSGALATAVLDWAVHRNIGFSHLVSLGDMSDVDFGDLLDYLALDEKTRAILLYVEAATNVRKFMSAGRIAARAKPVVVIKAGRSEAGAKAALSHTGALAGSDAVYDAALRRAGMLRVDSLRDLFEAAGTLAAGARPPGNRLAILTNGGGAGVLAADALADHGGELAELSEQTIAALDAALPANWSHGNPVDILGDAPPKLYADALGPILADDAHDGVLVLNCPTALVDSAEPAKAVIETVGRKDDKRPVITCWLGEGAAEPSRRLFAEHGLPGYETPGEAVKAFMQLAEHRASQTLLMEAPPAMAEGRTPDRDKARAIIAEVLEAGRTVLTEPEGKALLDAYAIPTLAAKTAANPEEAGKIAEEIGCPVALKILSPDISHKSDSGGVMLDLPSPEAVRDAAARMLKIVAANEPDAHLTGFTVQKMADRSRAHELIAGIAEDSLFGPIILFGQGGTAVEVIADRAVGLPPLNTVLAKDMIARTRVSKLLAGYRDRPAADLDAIAATLVKLSDMAADLAQLVELDINPLLADETGVIALDARVVAREASGPAPDRFAIRPYPGGLERTVELSGGETVSLRPARPGDAQAVRALIEQAGGEQARLRFASAVKMSPDAFAGRLVQIDYDREMVFVALDDQGAGLGVARMVADPDNLAAEFGVIVRGDRAGEGIGHALVEALIDHARKRGTGALFGDAQADNTAMLAIAGALGFEREDADEGMARLRLTLKTETPTAP